MPVRLIALAAVAALPIAVPAQHAAPRSEQLGVVSFANSGAPLAQKQFLRGVALLHSFMYGEAAAAFQLAQRADSGFAIAYWLEAATYVHSGWRQENLAAANVALERLAPTREERLARAGTPREQQYGAAVEALVAKGVPEQQRLRAFSDTMHAIAAAYPHDLDARSFAALGAMNVNYLYPAADSLQRARDHDAAEALAMGVYKESPKHPGGVHYVIHVNDDPTYAARGLDAARAYAKVAPDADHALHMPSHIFVQLGLWDDATRSNERAWPASRAAPMSHGDEGPSASWHSLQWLQYSYLQQGRRRAARALIDSARTILRGAPSNYWDDADARFVLSDMLFRYAAETGDGWAAVAPEVKAEGSDTRTPRGANFTNAAAFHAAAAGAISGDSSDARAYIKRIRARADSVTPIQRIRGELLTSQLEALIALSRADTTAALAAWQRASVADEGISPLGPPVFFPSHERLGELLLRRGQSSSAVAVYQKSLELRPNRAAALLGLARAQRASGDEKGATLTYRKLALQWHSADPSLRESRE